MCGTDEAVVFGEPDGRTGSDRGDTRAEYPGRERVLGKRQVCRAPLSEGSQVVFVRGSGLNVAGESGFERLDDIEPRGGLHLAHVLGAELAAVQGAGCLEQPSRRESLALCPRIGAREAQHALRRGRERGEVVAALDVVAVGMQSKPDHASVAVGEQRVLVAPGRKSALRHAEHKDRAEAGPVGVVQSPDEDPGTEALDASEGDVQLAGKRPPKARDVDARSGDFVERAEAGECGADSPRCLELRLWPVAAMAFTTEIAVDEPLEPSVRAHSTSIRSAV